MPGVPFAIGDVFAGIGSGQVAHLSPTGVLLDTLQGSSGNEGTGMCWDVQGNLYATTWNGNTINKFSKTGAFLGSWSDPIQQDCEDIVRNKAGDFYVGHADGSRQIAKFNSAGALVTSYSPVVGPRGCDHMDLAADQCTLFYTSEGNLVRRFNVCTGTQLPDFVTTPTPTNYGLRIRPNEEVMVASSTQVHRYAVNGALIQSYTNFSGASTLFALALDEDGISFWTANLPDGRVWRVNILTGAVMANFSVAYHASLAGLAVYGEFTAAQPVTTFAGNCWSVFSQ